MKMLGRTVVGAGMVGIALAAVVVSGCSASGASGSGGGATADGKAIYESKCGVCHTLDRPNAAKKDRTGWTATVDRMRAHGAKLDDTEAAAVIDYLVKRDGGQ